MDEKFQNEYKQLGLRITCHRKLKGLTQEFLAEIIDRSAAFIGHVEAPNVKKSVSLGTLLTIAKVLDVPVYKILPF